MDIITGHQTYLFQRLVAEGEFCRGVSLGEATESYLVFLLGRYTAKAWVADWDAATAYLEGILHQRAFRHEKMRETGDVCLLLAGLFPERAEKRASVRYYQTIGQGAYGGLGSDPSYILADLFRDMANNFPLLQEVLRHVRPINDWRLRI